MTRAFIRIPPQNKQNGTRAYPVNCRAKKENISGLRSKVDTCTRTRGEKMQALLLEAIINPRVRFVQLLRGSDSQKGPLPPSASNLLHCSAASHEWRLFKSPPSAPGNSFLCIAEFFGFSGFRRDPIPSPPCRCRCRPPRFSRSFLSGRRSREARQNCGGACPRKGQSSSDPPLRLLFSVFFPVDCGAVLRRPRLHSFCVRVRSGGDFSLGLVHLPMLPFFFALLLFLQKL